MNGLTLFQAKNVADANHFVSGRLETTPLLGYTQRVRVTSPCIMK